MFRSSVCVSRRCLFVKGKSEKWMSTALAPEMTPCDFVPDPYEGPSYDDVCRIKSQHMNPALKSLYKEPLLLHQGYKQWVFDHNNRRYLDMFAGIVTISVGHSHPKVTEALRKQAGKLTHTSSFFLNPIMHEYAEKLQSKMPGDLKNIFFCNSGTEANDMAIMLARLHTGTGDIISLRQCYHGTSNGVQGLTAVGNWRYNIPGGIGCHHTMNPDPYRGPWGGANCRDSPCQTDRTCDCAAGECKAGDMYLDQLNDVLNTSTVKGRVAGFFAESIQGVAGSVQFPRNFIKKAFELVRSRGGICISDEVQTGFGRTGKFWGFEGHDVVPDIVTMAKGIANGMPLSAVITTPEIAERLTDAVHINTFGGNPLSTAAASAVLDVIEEEKLQENADVVGTYFLKEMEKLKEHFPMIGDVRGKGLMTGIELVKDRTTREPIPADKTIAILDKCRDFGLIIGAGGPTKSVLRIKPPMCITKQDADFTVACLKVAFQDIQQEL